MPFYALRVTCSTCGAAFLVGGSPGSDLDLWRKLEVPCSRCSTSTPTSNGEAVSLGAPLADGSLERTQP
jgi:hypothetical protein